MENSKIMFDDWMLHTPPKLFARQFDHLSKELFVEGNLPDGYEWDMLVRSGGHTDIIKLFAVEGGVRAVLTAQQLALAGHYAMQLRGTKGEVVQHTNVITTYIAETLANGADWPNIPSEFTQMEQRISEIAAHPPVPGGDGFWRIWNPDTDEYESSEFPLPSGGGSDFLYRLGKTLKLIDVNTLEVNTADVVEKDNTLPITSAAVHTTVGNIEILLSRV